MITFSFGKNTRKLPTIRTYGSILRDQFEDVFIQILLIFASISLALSFFSTEKYKYLESVSIFFAVGLSSLVASLCDYGKEKQFLKL